MSAALRIALIGNPNVGKTSLFNALTGARQRVGNYAGVTVEIREGAIRPELTSTEGGGRRTLLIDLPGTYSLTPIAEDEAVALRGLEGELAEGDASASQRQPPDAVILVLDAANLARNLYLAVQVIEHGRPLVVALNMIDVAKAAGIVVDPEVLSRELGVPVIPTIARTGEGCPALVLAAMGVAAGGASPSPALTQLRTRLLRPLAEAGPAATALATLEQIAGPAAARGLLGARAVGTLALLGGDAGSLAAAEKIDAGDALEAASLLAIDRFREVDRMVEVLDVGQRQGAPAPAMAGSERLDRLLTHRLFGLVIFLGVMALLFTSIFAWADPVMGIIEEIMGWLSGQVRGLLGAGVFSDLLVDGVIAGVGNVLVFIPQIALLFLFIGLLEDSGYMARAAFLIDRLMAKVGLHGKAFVPLLSGVACAIPAILGTRTISSWRDRLVTILMIPYMSCSARLPIYVLLIAALFPTQEGVGPFNLGGLVLLGMYVLSTVSAIAVGAIYKRTILRSPTPPLVLELPPYRVPRLRNTLLLVFDRTMDFIREAGTVILAMTVVLWALLSFPKPPAPAEAPATVEAVERAEVDDTDPAIVHSLGGRIGLAIEPALTPMGQDWRIGIAILGSFAAREVMVSTLGLVYGIEGADEDDRPLREVLRNAKTPEGSRRYTPLGGLALMVFYVYACLCMSTVAVVRRETRSWRWPIFMFLSMTIFAYIAAVAVYQVGLLLGFT